MTGPRSFRPASKPKPDDIDGLIGRARRGDHDAFERAVSPYQRELHRHCYRMTGSLHDADDILQDTLLRAWRGLGTYRGTASFRAWLFRIATNRTIDLLAKPGPAVDAVNPSWDGSEDGLEPPWMQPYPGPAEMMETRESISTAFVVALQRLPAKQRAVLLLRDVLGFGIDDIATQIDGTSASVNSALQRARESVDRMTQPHQIRPPTEVEADLRDRLMATWMRADVDGFARLLTDDVRLTMPPIPDYFVGPGSVLECLTTVLAPNNNLGDMRLHPMVGNGQPGFGAYGLDGSTARFERRVVMTVAATARADDSTAARISGIHAYSIHTDIFDRFDLPIHG